MPITTTPSGGPQGEFSTYTPIYAQTLSSTAASITFSNIPTTFTDLILVCNPAAIDADFNALIMRFNGDSSVLYSWTFLRGNGTSATSGRSTGDTRIYLGQFALNGTVGDQNFIVNVQNYSNVSTNKTVIVRSNRASSSLESTVGLYRSTSAINSITIETSAGSANQLKSGSTFTLYGIKAAATQFIPTKAAGGDIVATDGTYAYHAFTTSGTFRPAQSLTCDILVVAGGGGSGLNVGGGGGGGGVTFNASQALTSGTNYAITIGAGGTPATSGSGGTGGTSSFSSIVTASGGTGGGSNVGLGGTAGSGGGNGGRGAPTEFGSAVAGTNGTSTYSSYGSATLSGQNVSGTYWYAGGGGGGGWSNAGAVGGNGGGGTGGSVVSGAGNPGTPGTANTGGGGGGTSSTTSANGVAGGSGIVIVRYPL